MRLEQDLVAIDHLLQTRVPFKLRLTHQRIKRFDGLTGQQFGMIPNVQEQIAPPFRGAHRKIVRQRFNDFFTTWRRALPHRRRIAFTRVARNWWLMPTKGRKNFQ